jgi:hypothetical protein
MGEMMADCELCEQLRHHHPSEMFTGSLNSRQVSATGIGYPPSSTAFWPNYAPKCAQDDINLFEIPNAAVIAGAALYFQWLAAS